MNAEAFLQRLNRITAQLGMVLGEREARRVVETCLTELGLSAVSSAEQLLALAQVMIKRGGFIEVVGRGLKVQALLDGAGSRVPPARHTKDDTGTQPRSDRRAHRA